MSESAADFFLEESSRLIHYSIIMFLEDTHRGWWRPLLDFVFPPLCAGCGEYTENESAVCNSCVKRIHSFDQVFCLNCLGMTEDSESCPHCRERFIPLFAYSQYTSPLEEIISHLKFKGITSPAPQLAELWCERFKDDLTKLQPELLIPIPLPSNREYQRGYNQASVLAGHLAANLQLPVREDILIRTGKRKPQARLPLSKRAENIKGVFSCVIPSESSSKVVLVDDVVTTGLTVKEALTVLKQNGFDPVAVIAIAHSP